MVPSERQDLAHEAESSPHTSTGESSLRAAYLQAAASIEEAGYPELDFSTFVLSMKASCLVHLDYPSQGSGAVPMGAVPTGAVPTGAALSGAVSGASGATADEASSGHPHRVLTREQLSFAKHTLDILVMLEQRTRGNLSGGEERLLLDAVDELQQRFVEASRLAASRLAALRG